MRYCPWGTLHRRGIHCSFEYPKAADDVPSTNEVLLQCWINVPLTNEVPLQRRIDVPPANEVRCSAEYHQVPSTAQPRWGAILPAILPLICAGGFGLDKDSMRQSEVLSLVLVSGFTVRGFFCVLPSWIVTSSNYFSRGSAIVLCVASCEEWPIMYPCRGSSRQSRPIPKGSSLSPR